ncbi:MAG: plasmid stabilization protein [Rhodospirillaceae bacterium]|nr:plasmid stabilization protein [Rhodospirillaceae bacterium]
MENMAVASIKVRDPGDDMKTRLLRRMSGNGRSMEEETPLNLGMVAGRKAEQQNLAAFIHECFAAYGGIEIELPLRRPMREPAHCD